MKRTIGLALAAFFAASIAYAQSPTPNQTIRPSETLQPNPAAEWVRSSKTAPEFWKKEKGWSPVPDANHAGAVSLLVFGEPERMELTLTLGIVTDVYQNEGGGWHAEVFSWQSKDGMKEEFGMIYGDNAPTLTRYAIKVGDRWFVAKEVGSPNKNDLLIHDAIIVQDPTGSLRPISVMIRLDTIDGAKDRLLILK